MGNNFRYSGEAGFSHHVRVYFPNRIKSVLLEVSWNISFPLSAKNCSGVTAVMAGNPARARITFKSGKALDQSPAALAKASARFR